MLFNSLPFVFFYPIVVIIFFLLPHKLRWFHLLVASCFFYMEFIPMYIIILGSTIVIDYFAGILIENAQGRTRRMYLYMSLVANIGCLGFFKYYNFFAENINALLHITHSSGHVPFLKILLPLGLSFHTFQAMSYTIEVYRGNQKAERHFGIYALYVMFFPQLVAGPIERPQNLLHQFHERKVFSYDNTVIGLKLILWGFFKKVVVADRLALLTDPVFNHPHNYPAITLAISTIFFTFQVFCDFSGYSDIALGTARILGFKLIQNFNNPDQSTSIAQFWRRWHMSLSTWFRDYLYIPLGGNNVSVPRWYFNLFFVFLVSGFWHGASWSFIIWGALHGSYMILALLTKDFWDSFNNKIGITEFPRFHKIVQIVTTFLLVAFSRIFFRANTIGDALYVMKKIPAIFTEAWTFITTRNLNLKFPHFGYNYMLVCIGLLAFVEWVNSVQFNSKVDITNLLQHKPVYVRWGAYYALTIAIVFFGVYENRQFIYFQF